MVEGGKKKPRGGPKRREDSFLSDEDSKGSYDINDLSDEQSDSSDGDLDMQDLSDDEE
jgi:hypothetical protein